MKRTVLIALFILCNSVSNSQSARLPHPVIFIHGLVSSDATWNQTVAALGGTAKVFDVCLNHDGNNLTASLTSADILPIGWRDGVAAPSPNRLYAINFDHSRFQAPGHSNHTLSNQAAIFKQGKALGAMIQAVLALEESRGVILIGHSMGGLAIREYLQRGFDGGPASRGMNWVDQTSLAGHRVVRVVTTGTPHLGSNHTGPFLSALAGVDERSEACRDLRFPYSAGFPVPVTVPAPFLFGGLENIFQWSVPPHNLDVNCNGITGDQIVGLSTSTTFNGSMPLPTNIRYT